MINILDFREAIETVRNGIKEIAKDQTVVIIVDELDRWPTYICN